MQSLNTFIGKINALCEKNTLLRACLAGKSSVTHLAITHLALPSVVALALSVGSAHAMSYAEAYADNGILTPELITVKHFDYEAQAIVVVACFGIPMYPDHHQEEPIYMLLNCGADLDDEEEMSRIIFARLASLDAVQDLQNTTVEIDINTQAYFSGVLSYEVLDPNEPDTLYPILNITAITDIQKFVED